MLSIKVNCVKIKVIDQSLFIPLLCLYEVDAGPLLWCLLQQCAARGIKLFIHLSVKVHSNICSSSFTLHASRIHIHRSMTPKDCVHLVSGILRYHGKFAPNPFGSYFDECQKNKNYIIIK